MGTPIEHHYHATAHAKGRQDGYGSVFKSLLSRAVAREGALLNTPERIVSYMQVCFVFGVGGVV